MPLISLIFFFSGLSALVYQLLWMRHLGFVFGNTIYASATVLTAFMGGLAIGSHLFGRWAENMRNPVRSFALLEFVIAGYALILPFLFDGIRIVYSLAYRHVSEDLLFLTGLRFALSFAILLIPCVCMGGTLPVLIRGVARDDVDFGKKLGWLYGVNTLGAVFGVALSGFYLIPAIGLSNTNLAAALTDVFAGLGALCVCGKYLIDQRTAVGTSSSFRWREISPIAKWAVLISAVCGFTSLALEVIWFRALILVFGSTTYSFTVMLAVFLLGIATGSLIIAAFLDRTKNLAGLLSVLVGAIGLYTLWSMYQFDRGPQYLLEYLNSNQFTWRSMNIARFNIAISHLAVPALLFGAAFTIATRIVRHESDSSSRTTGFVYALNTCGAVLGSFVAGFLMLPKIGMQASLTVIAFLLLVLGFVSLIIFSRKAPSRILSGSLLVAIMAYAVFFPPVWDKNMLSSGAYFGPYTFIRDGKIVLREMTLNNRLLVYKEALSSTISVHLADDELKSFCIDGKVEADQTPRSMVLQRMIGHLPLLFHPDAKKAVNIGLGAGVSFGALCQHPLDHKEVVEIEPQVQLATRAWGNLNHHVLDDPEAIVTINDGRNHLFSTTNHYDVITADPFEPVMAGAAHLYTVDYFNLARSKLNDNGIMGQFLPLYEMSLDDYLTIARSFVSVFPNSAIFFTGFDTVLIGFKGDAKMDAAVLRKNFEYPAVKASLSEVGFTSPEMILAMFVADLSDDKDFVSSGPINSDNYPIIEYSTPKSVLHYATDANQQALLRHFTPIPDAWLAGMDEEVANRLTQEHEAVRLMLEASVYRANGNIDEAFKLLGRANEISPASPVVKNELVAMLWVSGQQLIREGDYDEAARQFQIALSLDPENFWSVYHLITLAMNAGHHEYAEELLNHAEQVFPNSPLIMGQRGKYLFSMGQKEAGVNMLMRAVDVQPNSLQLWHDLRNVSTLAGNIISKTYADQNIARIEKYIAN